MKKVENELSSRYLKDSNSNNKQILQNEKFTKKTAVNVFVLNFFTQLSHFLRLAFILYHSMFPNVTFETTKTIPNPFECLGKKMLVRYERERERVL